MPNGMPPGFTPEQMAQAEELMKNMSPEQREEIMKQAMGGGMGGMPGMGGMSGMPGMGGMPGMDPHTEPKVDEID